MGTVLDSLHQAPQVHRVWGSMEMLSIERAQEGQEGLCGLGCLVWGLEDVRAWDQKPRS